MPVGIIDAFVELLVLPPDSLDAALLPVLDGIRAVFTQRLAKRIKPFKEFLFCRGGLDVTIADFSQVGLDIAARRAGAAGVSLQTVAVDLESDPLPHGPWDLILSVHHRSRLCAHGNGTG